MLPDRHRWRCLVVAARFMFIVNASIRVNLAMSEAGIEAVIVIYQIAFATLVITGGRRSVFLLGILDFTAASIRC